MCCPVNIPIGRHIGLSSTGSIVANNLASTAGAIPPFVPATQHILSCDIVPVTLESIPTEDIMDDDEEDTDAMDLYPMLSAVLPTLDADELSSPKPHRLPTLRNTVGKQAREKFALTLSDRVQTVLNQPFGKENIVQSFVAEASLRHILLPLWKSGFLTETEEEWEEPGHIGTAWKYLAQALPEAAQFITLVKEHLDIDVNPLRGYQKNWATEVELNQDRVRMTTAALLILDGDAAALTRWIGGPHVGAHRDVPKILKYLTGKVDAVTLVNITRILQSGIPSACNAESSEANFQAYLRYGNHSTVDEEPDKTYKALVKDSKRGYCLVFDPRTVHFALNCHVTPNGIIDLNKRFKNPRPIFDSSFRPHNWCSGINDWTTKTTEPDLHFATAFHKFLTWIYNLRITYPNEEIYVGDDDVSGAFRHCKYHPNLVAMHGCFQAHHLVMSTGATFGGNTSPSNWETFADARRQLAQWLYKRHDTVRLAAPFLPTLQLAPEPTPVEIQHFARADADSINTGVLDVNGQRLPPPYNHHVDDNLYADVGRFMKLAVSASALALYFILGFPTIWTPDCLSQEKLDAFYKHLRKTIGYAINSRDLTVGILPHKQEQTQILLADWLKKLNCTLLEASQLQGTLESITRYTTWARPWFFALQNAIRTELTKRYHILARAYSRSGRAKAIQASLPTNLLSRFDNLVSRDKAQLLWKSKASIAITSKIHTCLQHLLAYMTNTDQPFSAPIAFIIQRDPHWITVGDASKDGGGGYCEKLEFWFDVVWSAKVRHAVRNLPATHPDYVHINSLEFLVVIIQLIASVVRFQTLPERERKRFFPRGLPANPVSLCLTDNTSAMSWANRVTSKSAQGQRLLSIYSDILRTQNIGTNAEHLPGIKNIIADDISRPTHFNLSHAARAEQIYQKHAKMRTWSYFLPSQELLQRLGSQLFTEASPGQDSLPANLGQFVPVGSTISSSPLI